MMKLWVVLLFHNMACDTNTGRKEKIKKVGEGVRLLRKVFFTLLLLPWSLLNVMIF